MDNRVGTGSTLARAYGFLFGHIADVIGLGWLAAVFYGASVFFLIQRLTAALLIAPPSTPLLNQFTLLYFAGFLIATAFFGAAMSVAMTRNALGKLDSRAGVYFVFGLKEARAFWAFLKLYVIAAVLTLAAGVLSWNGALLAAAQIPPRQCVGGICIELRGAAFRLRRIGCGLLLLGFQLQRHDDHPARRSHDVARDLQQRHRHRRNLRDHADRRERIVRRRIGARLWRGERQS
jgi:hypothetical protein